MSTYIHVPHPHTLERLEHRDKPVKTADIVNEKATNRFNAWLAVKITNGVGTMWCAYAFAIVALIGLPPALKPGGEGIIAWIAQTFLQLVLLSIIIVGQNIAAASSDKRSENTYKDARWSNFEHRITPSELEPTTGWAMGNAGIIRELLRFIRIDAGDRRITTSFGRLSRPPVQKFFK
jgi:hypothetical protein